MSIIEEHAIHIVHASVMLVFSFSPVRTISVPWGILLGKGAALCTRIGLFRDRDSHTTLY